MTSYLEVLSNASGWENYYVSPVACLAVIIFYNGQSCVCSDAEYMASAFHVLLNQLTVTKKMHFIAFCNVSSESLCLLNQIILNSYFNRLVLCECG